MPPETALSLTALDRVLIHLKDYLHHADEREFPQAITQKGISEATGLRLTHVPRTLKSLEDRELVSSLKGHVRGEHRRYKVYFLTGKGREEANTVLAHLGSLTADTPEGPVKVGDVLNSRKGHALPILRELVGETCKPEVPERAVSGPVPNTDGFINRHHELEELGQMLGVPETRVMVIYGSQGYGISSLAARFVTEHACDWSVIWVEMRKDLDGLVNAIRDTARGIIPEFDLKPRTAKNLAEQLSGRKIILALDNYFEASDEAVEFMSNLVAAIKSTRDFKLLVTTREDTPAYNRFYTIIDQHDGTVGEVHIRGLDIEHCQILLGTPDIDPDALKRLFLFTRGKPPTLKLLAEGSEKELRQKTTFLPEEIKLMLFLKEQKKS
ncbi:MAG: hypothetical protein KKH41_03960 [Candidatus Thermoplasmatota archaeon]|nr:hypothetical protein [Euryarchaeota archaeon]MBU4031332.1 hypothetical protein [Candidatus Thermoplasmatota archaeon]MBU4071384.1 hypothetical protein [Candidatus Thermoplasmatota archaeon]MBU4143488.1 hypothetical protein [Candidatus Thermoplasmatota archaeon]MBU4591722.1 hypothetical protein [Candidatus Thermoplasmatota archaeon]